MVLTINDKTEASINRLLSAGKFRTAPEVIEAAVSALEMTDATGPTFEHFPVGSLSHLFTPEQIDLENTLLKGSSLVIDE